MTAEASHWLRLQLGMAASGAILWYAGVLLESDFASGLGVGVLVSALALRVMRRREEGDD